MTRGTITALVALSVVVGCGDDERERIEVADPVAEVLARMPVDSAAVAVVDVRRAEAVQQRALVAGLALGALQGRLAGVGFGGRLLDAADDLPLAVALAADRRTLIAAGVVESRRALDEAVAKEIRAERLKEDDPEGDLRVLRRPQGGAVAVKPPLVVAAATRAAAIRAATAASGAAVLQRRLAGLPRTAIVRAAIDPALVPRALVPATLRAAVPAIDGARAFAVAADGAPHGLKLTAHADLTGDPGLPDGPGPAAPLDLDAPVVAGVAGPADALGDIERIGRTLAPEAVDAIVGALRGAERVPGLSPRKAIGDEARETASLGHDPATKTTTLVVSLDDPAPAKRLLDRLDKVPAVAYDLAGFDGGDVDTAPDGVTEIVQDGRPLVRLAVLDKRLVATTSRTANLDVLAATPTLEPAEPLGGATTVRLRALLLRDAITRAARLPSTVAKAVLAPVGDLVLQVRAQGRRLTISARQALGR